MNIVILIFVISLVIVALSTILKRFYTGNTRVLEAKTFDLLEIQIRRSEDSSKVAQQASLAAENLFAALHGLLREEAHLQEHFSFEVVSSTETGLKFFVAVPSAVSSYVEGQIYAQYPECSITMVEDYAQNLDFGESTYEVATLNLEKKDFFPIKTYKDLEVDPMASITSVLSQIRADEKIYLQYLVRPVADTWQQEGHKYLSDMRAGIAGAPKSSIAKTVTNAAVKEAVGLVGGVLTGAFRYNEASAQAAAASKAEVFRLSPTEELQARSIEAKLGKMGFDIEVRIVSVANTPEVAEDKLRLILASFQQFSSPNINTFGHTLSVNKESYLAKYKSRMLEEENSFVLNIEELASIYHLPSQAIATPNISWVYSRKTEPPANIPTADCVYIGETVYRSKKTRFGIAEGDDRLRHMYVIGKSGTGKSTLFEHMLSQDIKNGHGVGILDPHGETIERVLEKIPDERVEDVIYFDPADTQNPIGLNLLQIDDPSQKNLLASGLVSAIKQHFDFSWGPRLEYLLNYAVLTLLEVPGTTLLGITRLLEDQNYQKFILHNVKDPVVQRFWEKEYKEFKGNQKLVTEAIAPIQNKVNRFLASSTIRNILGQSKSTIDIWDAMNSGKILLMNLSKGKIGADNANLLGALLVSRIQFYALQRANIAYEDRKPFYLYVDEFQNFATGSFEEILSESRKYKLGLYLTHQFTAQLPEDLLKAVYGNVGTIAAFSLGAPDAKALANEFAPYYTAEDIISLQRFELYLKIMINGMTSIPFSGRILLPWIEGESQAPKTNNKERVIELSRQKYGVDREYVESKIEKWVNAKFDKGAAIALEYKKQNNSDKEQI